MVESVSVLLACEVLGVCLGVARRDCISFGGVVLAGFQRTPGSCGNEGGAAAVVSASGLLLPQKIRSF